MDNEKKEQALPPCIVTELLEYEGGALRIDGSAPCAGAFAARLGGEELPLQFCGRYAQAELDGQMYSGRAAFSLEIPLEKLRRDTVLQFVKKNEAGEEEALPLLSVTYQARLHSGLKQAWWSFERYMVTLCRGRESAGKGTEFAGGLRIRRRGRFGRAVQELRFLKELLCAPYGSRQMFLMRGLYWLTFPFYARKNIWITFDKLYKGGDNGEYFYKYVSGRGKGGITPVYVIKKNAPDYGRLCREGYRPAIYRSRRQRLLYLNAAMVFGTHSGVHSFCGFNNWEVRFVQDRLHAVNTCIQHGLSVQNLEVDSNRTVNNNKRYYCASRCETENLSKPEYDYPPETLRLTGVPRYDGLKNQDKKQILITPTWRSYLAMHSVMGQTRPYNPEFKNTEYFRIFQSLLEDEMLTGTAKQTGYQIIYLLHPVISAQKEDFRAAPGVEIFPATEANYEELLTQSSLMVTDYSGVQFDFAYMRKPVVYFHPPELPPHYAGGGFSYETQGFGEICTSLSSLTGTLCDYMKNGCALKPFYRAREDAFFAFDDRENCRRIYEDALAYQKTYGR